MPSLFWLVGLLTISTQPAATPDAGVVFVGGGDAPHLLIERQPGADCAGAPTRFINSRLAVQCPAKVEAAQSLRWIGRTVRLHGGAGECTAKVVDLHVVAWFQPHFEYQGKWFDAWPHDATPPQGLLDAAWANAAMDDRFLAASLEVNDAKACQGARWAQPAEAEPARVRPSAKVSKRLHAQVLRRFRAHEGHVAMQRRFRAEATDAKGVWDRFDGARPAVRVFETEGATWIYAGASVGGCGYFEANFWAIWRRTGKTWELVTDADQVGEFIMPSLMIEGDAGPLFVDHTVLIAPRGPIYEVVEDVDVNHYICPC